MILDEEKKMNHLESRKLQEEIDELKEKLVQKELELGSLQKSVQIERKNNQKIKNDYQNAVEENENLRNEISKKKKSVRLDGKFF